MPEIFPDDSGNIGALIIDSHNCNFLVQDGEAVEFPRLLFEFSNDSSCKSLDMNFQESPILGGLLLQWSQNNLYLTYSLNDEQQCSASDLAIGFSVWAYVVFLNLDLFRVVLY